MRAGHPAGEDRGLFRLDRDHPQIGIALLEHAADAGQGASGADPAHHHIDPPIGVAPDFLGRGLAVDLRVGGVRELLRHVSVGQLAEQLFGTLDGPAHAACGGSQIEARA